MSFTRFITFVLLSFAVSTPVFAQSNLDRMVSEFMTDNRLSYEKLEKLESIRLKYGHESKVWKTAYKKWDKKKVTDSLFIEQFVRSRSDFRSKDLYTSVGFPRESLIRSIRDLEDRNKLNSESALFAKTIVYKTIDNEEIIRSDAREVGNYYQSLTHKYDTISEIAQFMKNLEGNFSLDSLKGMVVAIKNLDDNDWSKFKIYLRSKGYDKLNIGMFPKLDITRYQSGMTHLFQFYMNQLSSSAIRWDNEVIFMFEWYYTDSRTKNVFIAKALFDRLREFEIDQLDNSTAGKSILKSTTFSASTMLFSLQNNLNFQLEKYPILNSTKTDLEQLLDLAYNDVIFVYDIDFDKINKAIEKVDFGTFELNKEERAVIKALELKDTQKRQKELKLSVGNINLDKVEEFSLFRLAIYGTLVKQGFTSTSNWNQNVIVENPFESDSMDVAIANALPMELMNVVESEMHRINKERYFNLKEVILTVNSKGQFSIYPTIRHELRTEIEKSLERLANAHTFPEYVRWVISFDQSEQVSTETHQEYEIVRPPVPVYPNEGVYAVPPPPLPPAQTQQHLIAPANIVEFPDEDASFPGGTAAMKKWLDENLVYPEISRELGDKGRVYVTFVVEPDGSITGVEVMRGGITPELNREAKRLVKSMPKWTPGKVKGKPVRARCRVPILFELN